MNKKKLLIIICIVVVVIAVSIAAIILINNRQSGSNGNNNLVNNGDNSDVTQNLKVTGKLAEYIKGFTDNYYIKYSGNFKNNSGKTINTIAEYTKKRRKFCFKDK